MVSKIIEWKVNPDFYIKWKNNEVFSPQPLDTTKKELFSINIETIPRINEHININNITYHIKHIEYVIPIQINDDISLKIIIHELNKIDFFNHFL